MSFGTPQSRTLAGRDGDVVDVPLHIPTLDDLERAARRRGDLAAAVRLAALAKARGVDRDPASQR